MTLTAHKLGGPYGVGALVVRRELDADAAAARRRPGAAASGPAPSTCPRSPAFAAAVELAVKRQPDHAARVADAARRAGARGCSRWCPTRGSTGTAADRLPGNAHLIFPGCEGDSLLMLLDHRGIECSTGSACSAGVPQPSHVLLAMGRDETEARSSLRFTARATPAPRPTSTALVEAIGPVVERARAAAAMRVVAAMSGGVDSAVAAARAVEAGHEVTGIHLALSRNPEDLPRRRPRLLHDRGRQRRPPGRRRHRDPLLRLGPQRPVPRRRGRGLPVRVPRRPHPQPLPALQREDQVRRRPRPRAGARLRRGGHRPLRPAADRTGRAGRDAPGRVDAGKDQSYVLGVLTQEQLRALAVPARGHPQAAGARRGRAPGAARGRQARQPRHLLHRRRRHRGLAAGEARRRRPATFVDDVTGEVLGTHDGSFAFTIGQRRGLRIGTPGAGRPAALRPRHRAGLRHRHRRARARR